MSRHVRRVRGRGRQRFEVAESEPAVTVKVMTEQEAFDRGGIAALEVLRGVLVEDRGRIENDAEPVFDVIVSLMDSLLTGLRGRL